jgi:general nucleoside transport system ATP-binding protein
LGTTTHWHQVRAELRAFLQTTPFQLDLDATPQDLSAGEKQKLAILKQLYLKPRLLILDEPTSVLTPQEADEVLGLLKDRAHVGECTVLMITHKFREVMAYADNVSVLRRGALVASRAVDDVTSDQLAAAVVGQAQAVLPWPQACSAVPSSRTQRATPPRPCACKCVTFQ